MLAYTSFISDVHKTCRINSFASPDIFTFKFGKFLLVPNAILSQLKIKGFYMAKGCRIKLSLEPINTVLLILISKNIR